MHLPHVQNVQIEKIFTFDAILCEDCVFYPAFQLYHTTLKDILPGMYCILYHCNNSLLDV